MYVQGLVIIYPYKKNTLEFNGSIQLMIHWQSIDHQLTLGWIFHMQMRERSTHLHTVEISWPLLNAPIFSVQLTIVEYSFIFRVVDHCWTLLYFLCGWRLLNASIFSVRLTTVERSYIFCAVDHCWTLLCFLCSWPLLNAPIFSVRLTTVERSYIFCAVDHCWTLLCFLCSWPLLNAPIFSVRLTTVECSYIFFVCLMVYVSARHI